MMLLLWSQLFIFVTSNLPLVSSTGREGEELDRDTLELWKLSKYPLVVHLFPLYKVNIPELADYLNTTR